MSVAFAMINIGGTKITKRHIATLLVEYRVVSGEDNGNIMLCYNRTVLGYYRSGEDVPLTLSYGLRKGFLEMMMSELSLHS